VKPPRSFQAKLLWAHRHMDALRKDILTFGLSKPCVIVHDFQREGLKHTWCVSGNPDTPPQQLSDARARRERGPDGQGARGEREPDVSSGDGPSSEASYRSPGRHPQVFWRHRAASLDR
jgi:hypothetical protein